VKQIQAIIRPEKLGAVKQALDAVQSPGLTVWEIVGHGKQKGITEQFRGREFKVDFLPKTIVEIVVNDSDLNTIVKAISDACKTGNVGDGKIFISTIDEVVRIRTGETGKVAVG
jgi:nitrogen regulatory protein P-II 1